MTDEHDRLVTRPPRTVSTGDEIHLTKPFNRRQQRRQASKAACNFLSAAREVKILVRFSRGSVN
jgi:hypothetical protein